MVLFQFDKKGDYKKQFELNKKHFSNPTFPLKLFF